MKKISSSSRTFISKKIYPLLWFGPLAFFVFKMLMSGVKEVLVFLIFILMIGVLGFLLLKKLVWASADEVYDCGDYLLIKKGGEEERVALSNIMYISGPTFTSASSRLILRLVKPGKFGKEISFFPVEKFTLKSFAKNKIAEDLVARVGQVCRPSRMDQSKPITPEEKTGIKKIHWKYYGILIVMLSAVPVVGLAHSLTHSDTLAYILIIISFGTIFYLNYSAATSRCPRCGTSLAFSFILTYKCRNCGLRI